jgi:hypothetical protein
MPVKADMNKTAGAQAPLMMPRRFAIHLLHAAQLAGDEPFVGVVGAGAEPDSFLPLDGAVSLEDGIAGLRERQRGLWAVYLHRPGQPTAPTATDFGEQPQALRLTSSLATKGVLQLRAWQQREGRVEERELYLSD